MPIENGIQTPGSTGACTHLGEPLTCEQIRELPDGAEVIITWDGGNGPHPYRILVDTQGARRVEGVHNDRLLPLDGILESGTVDGGLQKSPIHRVTLGWDDTARKWFAEQPAEPDHIVERQEILRGIPQPVWTPTQMRIAVILAGINDELGQLPWQMIGSPLRVERELLVAVVWAAIRKVFGVDVWQALHSGLRAAATEHDMALADVFDAVDRRVLDLPYEVIGGVPFVDRDLIYGPAEQAAAAALGEHWMRALRRARNARN